MISDVLGSSGGLRLTTLLQITNSADTLTCNLPLILQVGGALSSKECPFPQKNRTSQTSDPKPQPQPSQNHLLYPATPGPLNKAPSCRKPREVQRKSDDVLTLHPSRLRALCTSLHRRVSLSKAEKVGNEFNSRVDEFLFLQSCHKSGIVFSLVSGTHQFSAYAFLFLTIQLSMLRRLGLYV